jgi:hypothetical protein
MAGLYISSAFLSAGHLVITFGGQQAHAMGHDGAGHCPVCYLYFTRGFPRWFPMIKLKGLCVPHQTRSLL